MKPAAVIRRSPEDFAVQEIPAFAPSGEGEHLYVELTKTSLTTEDAVRAIAQSLGVEARDAGYAGLKDKRAVTTQTLSFPFPRDRSVDDATRLELPGIVVRSAVRHPHKLRTGLLKGNRFAITLRDLPSAAIPGVVAALEEAGQRGVPNAYGPQRFGRHGDNAARAMAWLRGEDRGPRDRRERRLLFSALQSHLFNRVLERRFAAGTWGRALAGDLLRKCDSGGIFPCIDPAIDGPRVESAEVSPTGPMFGVKMRWPEGEPAAIEREVLAEATEGDDVFERHRALGEGSRRPLVLHAAELTVEKSDDDPAALRVLFVLPKGGYATTLLTWAVALQEETVTR